MKRIPLNVIKRMYKKAGAKRVNQQALMALADILAEITLHLGERSIMLAQHAKRKTVKKQDIMLAKTEIWG